MKIKRLFDIGTFILLLSHNLLIYRYILLKYLTCAVSLNTFNFCFTVCKRILCIIYIEVKRDRNDAIVIVNQCQTVELESQMLSSIFMRRCGYFPTDSSHNVYRVHCHQQTNCRIDASSDLNLHCCGLRFKIHTSFSFQFKLYIHVGYCSIHISLEIESNELSTDQLAMY